MSKPSNNPRNNRDAYRMQLLKDYALSLISTMLAFLNLLQYGASSSASGKPERAYLYIALVFLAGAIVATCMAAYVRHRRSRHRPDVPEEE